MPNIICEELVMKNGKVDIVEQELSKLWNEKIQRLEDENKKLKEDLQKCEKQKRNFVLMSKKVSKNNGEAHAKKGDLIMKLKEENKELLLDNESLGRQDKELKQERDNLRKEVAKLKENQLTEETAIQYVYENTSEYEDWIKGSDIYITKQAELAASEQFIHKLKEACSTNYQKQIAMTLMGTTPVPPQ